MSDSKQVQMGAVCSYVLIALNTLYGLLITPFIISNLGTLEYGVYKTITSFTASLMIVDMGIGGTVLRYVSSYRAKKEDGKIPNFVAMSLIQAFGICVILMVISIFIFKSIDMMYASTFTISQLAKAKQLFVILILNITLHIFENVINGVITGYNYFVFGNGVKIIRLIIRILLILLLLSVYHDSLILVSIDIFVTCIFLIVEVLFVKKKIRLSIKLTKWEKSIFLDSGKYTILMFITSIAVQVNNNMDNIVIGALSGPAFVTIYSIGLLIYATFQNLSTAISGVMLPTVSNLLESENANERVIRLIIKVGRIQFMLLGAAVVGFVAMGKDFIRVWLGNGYDDVYIITLILMLPSLFELCVNVCLSVLRAKNKLTFRTIVLGCSTLLNAIITYFAVKYVSYIGAAVGTAASFIIGSLIIMNIYYYKRMRYPMLKIYREIMRGTWLSLIIAGAGLFAFSRFFNGSIISLCADVLVFLIIYFIALWFFGLSENERKYIKRKNHNLSKIGRE